MALVTVIVPTHDHAACLPIALAGVCGQSVSDLRIVVIGDGVGDDTRAVMAAVDDPRVEFLDLPKQPRHAENIRHEVLLACDTPFVAYAGDDDLLLPHHLQTMLDVLGDADFVHPLPALVLPGPRLMVRPIDLSDAVDRRSVAPPIARAAVSLTGVVHTLDSYRRLPHGWRTTPAGVYTDQYMWSQYLAEPQVRAVSARRSTTIKLSAARRRSMTPAERGAEVADWWQASLAEGFVDRWDAAVAAAVRGGRPHTAFRRLLALGLYRWPDDSMDSVAARVLGLAERR